MLDSAIVHIIASQVISVSPSYPPSHTWYYVYNRPLRVEEICSIHRNKLIEVKCNVKNKAKFLETCVKHKALLTDAIEAYLICINEPYKPMPWEVTLMDIYLASCLAKSLCHNHVVYYLGQLNWLFNEGRKNSIDVQKYLLTYEF